MAEREFPIYEGDAETFKDDQVEFVFDYEYWRKLNCPNIQEED